MTAPCIEIRQLDSCLYEWAVVVGSETICGDVGESSILDCLKTAIGPMPADVFLVEIAYRGIHMGSFTAKEVHEAPGATASYISRRYAELALS
jgi:hypothetical protein